MSKAMDALLEKSKRRAIKLDENGKWPVEYIEKRFEIQTPYLWVIYPRPDIEVPSKVKRKGPFGGVILWGAFWKEDHFVHTYMYHDDKPSPFVWVTHNMDDDGYILNTEYYRYKATSYLSKAFMEHFLYRTVQASFNDVLEGSQKTSLIQNIGILPISYNMGREVVH